MKKIIAYLSLILAVDAVLLALIKLDFMPSCWTALGLILPCALIGGIGGEVYCLRAVYLNVCVKQSWDPKWEVWYYIRPLVSHACGAISFVFLKAGLLLLEAEGKPTSTELGFLAFAFIAGLNVDKFIAKVEDISQATWGIEKSRTARDKK